jgi:hypothetical protein
MLDRDTTIQYVQTSDLFQDIRCIITESQRYAYQAVNVALVQRNWLLGKRIAEEILKGEDRAEYGNAIIQNLAKGLTTEFGKGFTKTNLYQFVSFYKTFPDIFHAVSGKFTDLLSWTHCRILLQELDTATNNYLPQNTRRICLRKTSYVQKLKHKKGCSICNTPN